MYGTGRAHIAAHGTGMGTLSGVPPIAGSCAENPLNTILD